MSMVLEAMKTNMNEKQYQVYLRKKLFFFFYEIVFKKNIGRKLC